MKQITKDKTRERTALLKILAISSRSKQQGKSKSVKTAFADIRNEIEADNKKYESTTPR